MANNYTIKLNLSKFKNSALRTVKGKDGKDHKVFILSVDDNKEIFVGEKSVFLNLAAFETKEVSQYGDTHLVKGSVDKETYDAMREEDRRSQPIVGNMRPLGKPAMPAPELPAEALAPVNDNDDDDLPF